MFVDRSSCLARHATFRTAQGCASRSALVPDQFGGRAGTDSSLAAMGTISQQTGSPASCCMTNPCPYCTIGVSHDMPWVEMLVWWQHRCSHFVDDAHLQKDEAWTFFIHAMAARSIMQQSGRHRATATPRAHPATASTTMTMTMTSSSSTSRTPGSGGQPMVVPPPPPAARHVPQREKVKFGIGSIAEEKRGQDNGNLLTRVCQSNLRKLGETKQRASLCAMNGVGRASTNFAQWLVKTFR